MDQLVVLQEIFESFARGGDSLRTIDPKTISGSCASQVGRLLRSIQNGEIDRDLCSKLAECLTDLYELKRLGDICRRAGLFDVSHTCYNKALSTSTDPQVRAVLLNNLGQVFARQEDLSRAVLYYKKAVEGFESVADSSGAAHVLGNLGSAYRRGYDWDRAVENCFKSLKIFEDMGDELGIAQMTGSLGRVYAEMGERDLAALYYERSLRQFERLGDRRSAAWLLNRLAKVKEEMRAWEESADYYKRSLGIFDELSQPHNAGVVLSNMGRMYLDKGDTSTAVDALERGQKLIRRDMIPIYPNTVSCLAAAYTLIARDHEAMVDEMAKDRREPQGAGGEDLLRQASHYYARASDRYTDLASLPEIYHPDIKVAAGISRARSYLAGVGSGARDEVALARVERAISALDLAVSNANTDDKLRIEAVKRGLMGMKEIWSLGLSRNEPWKLTKGLSEAVEYLMGGARSCGDGGDATSDACRCIYDALKGLGGAIENEKLRRDSSEQIRIARTNIQRAERQFEALGTKLGKDSSFWLRRASMQLDSIPVVAGGSDSRVGAISGLVNYSAGVNPLLLIGRVLVKNALFAVDRTDWVYVWDDAVNLVELGPAGRLDERTKIPVSMKIEDLGDLEVEPVMADEDVLDRSTVINPGQIIETEYQSTLEPPLDEPYTPGGSLMPLIGGTTYATTNNASYATTSLLPVVQRKDYGEFKRSGTSTPVERSYPSFEDEGPIQRTSGTRRSYDGPGTEKSAGFSNESYARRSRQRIRIPSLGLPFDLTIGTLAPAMVKGLTALVALLLGVDGVLHLI